MVDQELDQAVRERQLQAVPRHPVDEQRGGAGEPLPKQQQVVKVYLGLNPSEDSSGANHNGFWVGISKQGHSMMRWLFVEAAQTACAFHAELRRDYLRLSFAVGMGWPKGGLAETIGRALSGGYANRPVSAAGSHAG